MKYDLYASIQRSRGDVLRFVVRFDTLDDVVTYLKRTRGILPNWKLVQTYVGLSRAEKELLPPKPEYYEADLSF